MHYVTIIDPGISGAEPAGSYPPFDRGLEMDIFVKNETADIFFGRVWNEVGVTVFPDFTHPNASDYWFEMMDAFRQKAPIDGAWIDMNDPSNFEDGQLKLGCDTNNKLNEPPYMPRYVSGGKLYYKTICPSAKQALGRHYDLHNLYGFTEAKATFKALSKSRKGKRPFVISRSSFPGQGQFGGVWTGDIHSDWDAMATSIAGE